MANYDSSTVGEYTVNNGTVTSSSPNLITNLTPLTYIAVDSSNHLYANSSSYPYYVVGEYNATTGATINSTLVNSIPNSPPTFAVDGSSNLYVAERYNGVVQQYHLGNGTVTSSYSISGLTNVLNVAVDGAGHLYVNNYVPGGTGWIAEYNARTGAVINANLVTGLTGNQYGFTVDNSGHLYLATLGSIAEYNASTGAVINSSLVTNVPYPYGIAIDGSGNLYVDNFVSGTVGEYTISNGTVISSNANLITGLDGPFGIAIPAVASVPEPSGFALLGMAIIMFAGYYGWRWRKPAVA